LRDATQWKPSPRPRSNWEARRAAKADRSRCVPRDSDTGWQRARTRSKNNLQPRPGGPAGVPSHWNGELSASVEPNRLLCEAALIARPCGAYEEPPQRFPPLCCPELPIHPRGRRRRSPHSHVDALGRLTWTTPGQMASRRVFMWAGFFGEARVWGTFRRVSGE
jgi:hypothetical protein